MLPLDFIEYLYLYLYTKEEYDCLGLYLFRMVIAHFSLLNCHKIIVTPLKFDITLKRKRKQLTDFLSSRKQTFQTLTRKMCVGYTNIL